MLHLDIRQKQKPSVPTGKALDSWRRDTVEFLVEFNLRTCCGMIVCFTATILFLWSWEAKIVTEIEIRLIAQP